MLFCWVVFRFFLSNAAKFSTVKQFLPEMELILIIVLAVYCMY